MDIKEEAERMLGRDGPILQVGATLMIAVALSKLADVAKDYVDAYRTRTKQL